LMTSKVSLTTLVELAKKYEHTAFSYECSEADAFDYSDVVKVREELHSLLNDLMVNGWANDMACSAGFATYYSGGETDD